MAWKIRYTPRISTIGAPEVNMQSTGLDVCKRQTMQALAPSVHIFTISQIFLFYIDL
jgi:hypothetical protein